MLVIMKEEMLTQTQAFREVKEIKHRETAMATREEFPGMT